MARSNSVLVCLTRKELFFVWLCVACPRLCYNRRLQLDRLQLSVCRKKEDVWLLLAIKRGLWVAPGRGLEVEESLEDN